MNQNDFLCLSPLIIVTAAPVIMMLMVAAKRNIRAVFYFSVIAFVIAFLSLILVARGNLPCSASKMLVIDGFSLLFFGIFLLSALFITLLAHHYILRQESEKEEFFIILFVAVLGSMLLVAATSFVTLFLGLETLSLSLFILIAYRRARHNSMEAGVKYLILASVSSAFLLFGMGLIYTETGSLDFRGIASFFNQITGTNYLLFTGFGMILVGVGFKLALVPFHMWTPDIYEGAPIPIATYVATISKAAVLALILRFFIMIHGYQNSNFILVITVIAVLSMFVGNLLAIRQNNIRRILAYSSIANMGYIIITLLLTDRSGAPVAVFYMLAYIVTILGAFGVLTLVSDQENDIGMISDVRGLFWSHPWLAMVFTLCLLSLAGIPLTAGFMAKFYLVMEGINSRLDLLVIALVLSSVIGLYYYLRIITTMFAGNPERTLQRVTPAGNLFLAIISAGILWFGLFPEWVLELITHYSGI